MLPPDSNHVDHHHFREGGDPLAKFATEPLETIGKPWGKEPKGPDKKEKAMFT